MADYIKINKKDGEVLSEFDLIHIEDGILNSSTAINKINSDFDEHKKNHPTTIHTHEEFDIVVYSDDGSNSDIELPVGNTGSFIGPNEPNSKDLIWFDTDDEEIDVNLSDSEILEEFKHSLKDMRTKVDETDYVVKYKLDGGYFLGKEPGTNIDPYKETNSLIEYIGNWEIDNEAKHFDGTAKYSSTPNDTFKFSFDGAGFKIYGLCSTTTGRVNVYINGEKVEIDTYSTFDFYRNCYCNKLMLEDGHHQVIVEVAGSKNSSSTGTSIYVDKIEIINGYLIANSTIQTFADEVGEEEENPSPFPNSSNNKYAGNIGALSLKRGYKADLTDLPLMEGELAYCIDTDELYIGNRGIKKLLAKAGGTGGSGGGGGSLTGKYVELESSIGKKYRVSINNDGDLEVWDSAVDTAVDAAKNEASKFTGLIINHVYGGGKKDTNLSVISHSYIELYNNSKIPLNLKGLSIQYASNNEKWDALPLRGIVKPQHSFLIRGCQVTSPSRPQVRHKIDKYDMHWEKEISSNSIKTYLCIGTEPCKYTNPFNINGAGMKDEGYIDLFAVGGRNTMFTIDAAETSYIHAIDIDHSAHRIDFADTDKGFEDIEAINMKIAPTELYKPRSSSYGKWDVHYDKLELDPIVPMMVNMCFGYDGNKTRTFTWQTKNPVTNYLQYRLKGSSDWIIKKCDKKTVTHPDTDATVHSVIIHDLAEGMYEYRAGCEGRWTDIYEFEVKYPANTDTINFIQVSDQQGWNKYEYDAWETIANLIEERETFDFVINAGDISQNGGSKAFEWRYYYDMAKNSLYKRPHMTVVGNNDLTIDDEGKKTDPTAFTYYTTVENSEHISCYSYNYGYCHFIFLNSNVITETSDILLDQLNWLRRDMANPENKKRWIIVTMHEAPYTQTRSAILVPFINVLAEIGADLVMCGHHHRYSRSKRMGALGPNGENRVSSTGFYTVMGQAAGFKLSGKSPEAPNNSEWMQVYNTNQIPMYIHWEITYEKIKMNCYRVEDLVPYEENIGKPPRVVSFDTGFEITKPL